MPWKISKLSVYDAKNAINGILDIVLLLFSGLCWHSAITAAIVNRCFVLSYHLGALNDIKVHVSDEPMLKSWTLVSPLLYCPSLISLNHSYCHYFRRSQIPTFWRKVTIPKLLEIFAHVSTERILKNKKSHHFSWMCCLLSMDVTFIELCVIMHTGGRIFFLSRLFQTGSHFRIDSKWELQLICRARACVCACVRD